MKKNKTRNAEVYSFKAISSQQNSQGSLSESRKSQNIQQKQFSNQFKPYQLITSQSYPNKIKQGIYRHQLPNKQVKEQPQLKIDMIFKKKQIDYRSNLINDLKIHPKVALLDNQIQQNVKRRMQLQIEVKRLRQIAKENQISRQILSKTNINLNGNYNLSNLVPQQQFALRNKQTDFINQMMHGGTAKSFNNTIKTTQSIPIKKNLNQKQRIQQINKNIQLLTDNNIESILRNGFKQSNQNNLKNDFYDLNSFLAIDKQIAINKKNNPSKKSSNNLQNPTPPPISVIQQLLTRLTFPQIPKQNVQKLYANCQHLYSIHQSHSDLVYLMMVSSFHLNNHHDVRKYFKEILTFKKFQLKAYWVAAETEYVLQNFERCIKLTDFCMQNIDDRYFPRFLYLKAKCYYEQGNFTNSIVCYNQLIRIKPKIPEYYLQRAVLYDKLGYEKQCKQDYLMFGILKPESKKYLQQKIIVQQNEGKRKQLLQIYKKMV